MRKRFLMLALIVVAAAAALWYAGSPRSSVSSPNGPKQDIGITVGKQVPVFTLNSLDGINTTVGTPGKVTVINFWATWCPPCRQEMPELNNFWQQHGQEFAFYAVNIQEQPEIVKAFMNSNQYSLLVLLDVNGEIAKTFRVNAIPTTLVVDKQGIIRYRKTGPVTENELEGVIKGL